MRMTRTSKLSIYFGQSHCGHRPHSDASAPLGHSTYNVLLFRKIEELSRIQHCFKSCNYKEEEDPCEKSAEITLWQVANELQKQVKQKENPYLNNVMTNVCQQTITP